MYFRVFFCIKNNKIIIIQHNGGHHECEQLITTVPTKYLGNTGVPGLNEKSPLDKHHHLFVLGSSNKKIGHSFFQTGQPFSLVLSLSIY